MKKLVGFMVMLLLLLSVAPVRADTSSNTTPAVKSILIVTPTKVKLLLMDKELSNVVNETNFGKYGDIAKKAFLLNPNDLLTVGYENVENGIIFDYSYSYGVAGFKKINGTLYWTVREIELKRPMTMIFQKTEPYEANLTKYMLVLVDDLPDKAVGKVIPERHYRRVYVLDWNRVVFVTIADNGYVTIEFKQDSEVGDSFGNLEGKQIRVWRENGTEITGGYITGWKIYDNNVDFIFLYDSNCYKVTTGSGVTFTKVSKKCDNPHASVIHYNSVEGATVHIVNKTVSTMDIIVVVVLFILVVIGAYAVYVNVRKDDEESE